MKTFNLGLKSGKVITGIEYETENALYNWFANQASVYPESYVMVKNAEGRTYMVYGKNFEYIELQA
ncbi:hypothetical protein ABEG75_22875 [Pantoea agglomerans]|uniref:hypothetical protein n=1 Tax=Enterobacter agglomerans TaxID=549 RepID=UPI0016542F87|nr:hypothetical protein [Pantoea agglomerans]